MEKRRREPGEDHPKEGDGAPRPGAEASSEGRGTPRDGAAARSHVVISTYGAMMAVGRSTSGSRSNRPIEILDQVLGIFEPYTHPNEAVRDPADPPLLVGEWTVCHGGRMLDEGLGAPEAHGERRDVDGLDELLPGPVAARELEAEPPPEAGHLLPREGVLRERFQPGIVHDADATAAVEEFRQRLGRFRLRRHSKGERLQSPSNEERFEGAECRSQH